MGDMARQVMNILHLDMPADNTATGGDPQKVEVTQASLQPAIPSRCQSFAFHEMLEAYREREEESVTPPSCHPLQ